LELCLIRTIMNFKIIVKGSVHLLKDVTVRTASNN
jgi:hypothetical protein